MNLSEVSNEDLVEEIRRRTCIDVEFRNVGWGYLLDEDNEPERAPQFFLERIKYFETFGCIDSERIYLSLENLKLPPGVVQISGRKFEYREGGTPALEKELRKWGFISLQPK